MILDIIQTIVNYGSSLPDQLCCMQIDSYCYNNIYIYKLDAHFSYSRYNVTQKVIKQNKFNRLEYLDCSGNADIKNINHLAKTLNTLHCRSIVSDVGQQIKISGIGQTSISKLEKIKILDCSFNEKISDVNHLSETLEELYCCMYSVGGNGGGNEGISQNGISKLKLKLLDCSNNYDIYDISHMADTLEKLICGGNTSINQTSITPLTKLKKLDCSCNSNITDVNHLSETLEILKCCDEITQDGISKLLKLVELDCGYNMKLTNFNHLADTLEKLFCGHNAPGSQHGISALTKIKELRCAPGINDVNHLADTLEYLDCGNTDINQTGISKLKKLKTLLCHEKRKIYNVNHLADTLEKLQCTGSFTGINQEGISKLRKLKYLDCGHNSKINNVDHLKDTLEVLYCDGDSGINQKGILKLKKIKCLNCHKNSKIKNVNHLSATLEELGCRGSCGINQYGISKLKNLKKLDHHNNRKINMFSME